MAIALIKWTGLPERPQTYSWFSLMIKRYGEEVVRAVTVSILEAGTTVEDFNDDPRHMRSWIVAILKAKKEEGMLPDNAVNFLEMWK